MIHSQHDAFGIPVFRPDWIVRSSLRLSGVAPAVAASNGASAVQITSWVDSRTVQERVTARVSWGHNTYRSMRAVPMDSLHLLLACHHIELHHLRGCDCAGAVIANPRTATESLAVLFHNTSALKHRSSLVLRGEYRVGGSGSKLAHFTSATIPVC